MVFRFVLGALALVLLGGGAAVAVVSDKTACEGYADTVARAQHLPFAESQRVQADALANCYAEQARATGK